VRASGGGGEREREEDEDERAPPIGIVETSDHPNRGIRGGALSPRVGGQMVFARPMTFRRDGGSVLMLEVAEDG